MSDTAAAAAVAVVDPPPATREALATPAVRRQWVPILLATVIFSALSLTAAVKSAGFLEADSCTHFQYAKFALAEPHYLVNVWGRPFVTALYAIPAVLAGRMGVRVTSLVCALLTATIAWRLAKDQKYRLPAVAFIFTLAQPLLFLHSFSELTELPFALLLALAFWSYRRRQWLVMAVFAALLPTARPEGFGFLVLAAGALIAHRRWWWLIVLPLPLLLWTYAGWRLYGRPVYADALSQKLPPAWHWLMWLRHEWPYAATSAYASGSIWHFALALPVFVGPMMTPFFLMGVWRSVCGGARSHEGTKARSGGEGTGAGSESTSSSSTSPPLRAFVASWLRAFFSSDHLARTQILIVAIPLMILAGHSVLYRLGKMASNGELRYMLIVAPFWALLAAKGWEWAFQQRGWRHPFVLAGAAALLPILANSYYRVVPINLTLDSYKAQAVATWYRDTHVSIDYPRVLSSNPEVAYFLGVSLTDGGRMREWRKETIAKAQPGTLLIWDEIYGLKNADTNRIVTLEEIRAAGWVERPDLAAPINDMGDGNAWHVFVSPRSIFGNKSV